MNDTKCRCGCGLDITPAMRWVLESIERDMVIAFSGKYELILSCGARCEKHNAEVGGVINSAHCLGLAADVGLSSSQEIFYFLRSCFGKSIKRIEDRLLNRHYLHIDIATGAVPHPSEDLKEYPQNVFIVLS